MLHHGWMLMVAFTVAACGAEDVEDVPMGCQDVRETPVSDDDVAPNGLMPSMVWETAAGKRNHRLLYQIPVGTDTDVMLSVQENGTPARYVEREDPDPLSPSSCTPQLRLGVDVSLVTADGLFDEQFDAELIATADSEGYPDPPPWSAYVSHALADAQGTFDLSEWVPPSDQHETTDLNVNFSIRDDGWLLNGAITATADVLPDVEEAQEETMTPYNANRARPISVGIARFPVDVVGS